MGRGVGGAASQVPGTQRLGDGSGGDTERVACGVGWAGRDVETVDDVGEGGAKDQAHGGGDVCCFGTGREPGCERAREAGAGVGLQHREQHQGAEQAHWGGAEGGSEPRRGQDSIGVAGHDGDGMGHEGAIAREDIFGASGGGTGSDDWGRLGGIVWARQGGEGMGS